MLDHWQRLSAEGIANRIRLTGMASDDAAIAEAASACRIPEECVALWVKHVRAMVANPVTYAALLEDEERGAELAGRIINLTPHVVRLLERNGADGFTLLAVLDPDPRGPARAMLVPGVFLQPSCLAGTRLAVRKAATRPYAGGVTGLPERAGYLVPTGSSNGTMMEVPTAPGDPVTLFIVSTLVGQALAGQGRDDCFTVSTQAGEVERKDGQVWGTYALEQVPQ